MEIKTCALKSNYIIVDDQFFNYKIQYLNLFPSQLKNVLSIGEFYQIIDGINSIKMVRPHSYIIVLLQSISLYFLLQLMVVGNFISKLNCTIFFSLVLLHFIYVSIIFIKCLYKSFKLKFYLSKLNKQFRDRSIKFKIQLEKDNNIISFSFGFICKILFLLIPFFLQLEIIYGKNQSQYVYYLCFIILIIFLIFIFNVSKNLILFTKLKKFIYDDKEIDLSQLFFIESLIITYNSTTLIDNNNSINNNNDSDLIIPDYNETSSLLDYNV